MKMETKTLLHYKIIEKIGEGGMGVVYKAEDNKLKRTVAIKFLSNLISSSKEERSRFEIEAQVAASLNHHNITVIHSIEEIDDKIFIVMEYVDGTELYNKIIKGLLPVGETINIAIQIAEGLNNAHKKGIIHRDIKSSNIMITHDGKVKIMDFGLAKLKGKANITDTGVTLGTVAYMSPEQAGGEEVDHRTDIWSFGVVLYEMLTGVNPFKREYEAAIIYAILNEEQEDIRKYNSKAPGKIIDLVNKMLSKDINKRYQNMDDILNELKTISRLFKTMNEDKKNELPSIAVLPFADMSPGRDQDYFCEGVAEEILNSLNKIKNIRVSSRTSSFQFKESSADIREIGNRLNVNSVLEGSVRKAGNKLRINVHLTNVSDGFYLWSERYDRELEDVFTIQEDIAENVITSLRGVLTPMEKQAIRRPEAIIEAYEYFLKGRQFFHKLLLNEAKGMFEKAIEIDSEYALAYAGLADVHSWFYEWIGGKESDLKAAEDNSIKALSLAPQLAESHSSRGFVLSLAGKYDEAEKEFIEAIRLNSNSYEAHYLYGRACFARGKIAESAELFKKASEIRQEDFQSVLLWSQSLQVLGKDKDKAVVREGINRAKKILKINPDDRRALSLVSTDLLEIGEREEGLLYINKALKLYPDDAGVLINGACFFARDGNKEKAISLLEKVFGQGFGKKDWIEHDPDYDSLRDEPRFQALLKKLK